MLQISPVGKNSELVTNQWRYKYMYCEDLTLDIPLPWDIKIPGNTTNFKLDFGIRIDSPVTYMVVPHTNLGYLRMAFSPQVMNPGIHRLIISIDNYTQNSIQLYNGNSYITMVSLTNEGILFNYSINKVRLKLD